MNIAKRSYA